MAALAAKRPDDNHEPPLQAPEGLEASLAIVPSIVFDRDAPAGQNLNRIREIEPAMLERPLALSGVEADLHDLDLRP